MKPFHQRTWPQTRGFPWPRRLYVLLQPVCVAQQEITSAWLFLRKVREPFYLFLILAADKELAVGVQSILQQVPGPDDVAGALALPVAVHRISGGHFVSALLLNEFSFFIFLEIKVKARGWASDRLQVRLNVGQHAVAEVCRPLSSIGTTY